MKTKADVDCCKTVDYQIITVMLKTFRGQQSLYIYLYFQTSSLAVVLFTQRLVGLVFGLISDETVGNI